MTETHSLAMGSILLHHEDGVWTLCRMQSNSATESPDAFTLCFDESVHLVTNDSDSERILPMLDPYLSPTRFAVADASTVHDCPDPSHRHLSIIPESPERPHPS